MKKANFFNENAEHIVYINIVIIELVENNDYEGLKQWLESGNNYDINEKDAQGNCAVTIAACNNNFMILELLASFDARFDVVDGCGNTPLFYAEENGNKDMEDYIRERINLDSMRSTFSPYAY